MKNLEIIKIKASKQFEAVYFSFRSVDPAVDYLAGFLGLIIIIILFPSSLGSWSTFPTCSNS